MEENFELRDFYNPTSLTTLATSIRELDPSFNAEYFLKKVLPALPPLGLLERSNLICDALAEFLPDDFKKATKVLVDNAHKTLPLEGENAVNSFLLLPHTQYIARYGKEAFETSMAALYALTKKFTAEFAIRPFLIHSTEQTLAVLHKWALDENEHVRRLVSEGTRPLLPWAMKLKMFEKDPEPCFALLEKLKADTSVYVRKSVANHLNDHSKKHPVKVVALLQRWNREIKTQEMKWITRHALRTLVKKGDPAALSLLGFGPPTHIELAALRIAETDVVFGNHLTFECDIKSDHDEPVKLLIDYVLYFKKANGTLAPKVFKLKQTTILPGEMISIRKKHPIRPITTRKYYPGTQELSIQVNGREMGREKFKLVMDL